LTIFAVAAIGMVTGAAPHRKVITPPAATAATTAADVQLAAVPVPITRSGREVSTARGSAGMGAPGAVTVVASGFGVGVRLAATTLPADGIGGAGRPVAGAAVVLAATLGAGAATDSTVGLDGDPQAASAAIPTTTRPARRNRTAGG
jgi:hypothetical protein